MLWRAGSGHSHLRRAPPYLHSLRELPPVWPSSRASARLTPPPRPAEAGQVARIEAPQFRFTGCVSRSLLAKFPLEMSALLSVIEKLSSAAIPKDEALVRLQALPSSHLVLDSKKICAFAQEMVEQSCPERAIHLLHVAHQLGTKLVHSQYEQIVYRLAMRKYWRHVYSVAAVARHLTGRWTVRLLNWALRSHLETQQYRLLDGALDILEQNQLKPTRRTYELLVRGHLNNSDLAHARHCLLHMQAAGFEMNKSTFLTVLGSYRSLGPNQVVEAQAFQALQGTGDRSDTFILNGIMQLRIDDGDVAGALRVLDLFDLPPLGDGNVGDSELPPTPQSQSGSSPNVLPDNVTFNVLLMFLAQQKGQLDHVIRAFRQMSTAGLQADADTAAALIRAYSTAKMSSTAVGIVAEMCKRHNLAVGVREFRILGGSFVAVDGLLQGLDVRPNVHVFNALLQAVLPEHGLLGMRMVLRIMRQTSVTPDASTTLIIISYLDNVQHMHPRSFIRVVQTLTTFPTDQVSLTLQHVNAVLRSLLKRERDIIRTRSWSTTAQRLRFGHISRFSWNRGPQMAAKFDPTAGIALDSFRRSTRRLLEPIIQSLSERQVMSDRMTFALRIKRDAVMRRDPDSAQRVFDAMVARGIRPNAYHFSAMIEGHAEAGNMRSAWAVMERAAGAGVAPNVVMYTIIIVGYARMGRPDLAKRTFSGMVAAGVRPDFAVVDAVVSAFWFVRAYGTARELLLDLWPLVAPFPSELKDAPLRVLAQTLRALRQDAKVTIPPIESPQARGQRMLLKRRVGRTLSELKQWRQVLESVFWAKQDIGLSPMLRRNMSSKAENTQF